MISFRQASFENYFMVLKYRKSENEMQILANDGRFRKCIDVSLDKHSCDRLYHKVEMFFFDVLETYRLVE